MNTYEQNLYNSIKEKTNLNNLDYSNINSYNNKNKLEILVLAIKWACQSQTIAAIEAGRKVISHFEEEWLRDNFILTSMKTIDINDAWEVRRLLEITKGMIPILTEEVLNYVKISENAEKDELVQDFENSN